MDDRAGHLKVLGLPPDCASEAEIKAAYRRLALRLHPDKPGGDEEAFKRLQGAYAALTDPSPAPPHPGGGPFAGFGFGFDPFAAFRGFGFGPPGGGGGGRATPHTPPPS